MSFRLRCREIDSGSKLLSPITTSLSALHSSFMACLTLLPQIRMDLSKAVNAGMPQSSRGADYKRIEKLQCLKLRTYDSFARRICSLSQSHTQLLQADRWHFYGRDSRCATPFNQSAHSAKKHLPRRLVIVV